MKIIIDISERIKQSIDNNEGVPNCLLYELYESIKESTSLPEHHKRLIEKINSKKTYKGRAAYSDMHDADMDKIYDIALDKAIEIIKEYCEVEK